MVYIDLYITQYIFSCCVPRYIDIRNVNGYLRIPAPETMTIQVKGITACLWPASVVITFPLQCGKRPQVTPISVGHKVVGKNAVQFGHCPLSTLFWRYLQLRLHILGKPLSQLSWKPAKNRMGFAILVCDPLWYRHTVTYQHPSPATATASCLAAFKR